MDFIERIVGIAPDGGDGSTELVILVAVAFVAAALIRRAHIARSIQVLDDAIA